MAIVSSAAAVTRLAIGTAPQAITVSTGLLPVWSAPVLQSYLSGCQITAIGGTSSGTITHSSGIAVDSTANVTAMVLASLVGTTTGTFIAGTNQPKLDTNSTGLATSQWYHIYVISSVAGGSPDVLYSSSTSPTMPTGYAKQRRVGSFRTGSTGNILPMVQDGDLFRWTTLPAIDVSALNPGTAAVTRSVTVPTGVNVIARVHWDAQNVAAAGTVYLYISDLAVTDELPARSTAPLSQVPACFAGGGGVLDSYATIDTRTNTSAQVRTRLSFSTSDVTLTGVAIGWTDSRGRNA